MKTPEQEKERLKKYRKEHPEKAREYTAKWRAKNKEKFKEYQKTYSKENRERLAENTRKWRASGGKQKEAEATMRRNYGIGFDEYNKMLESQGGVCAICKGEDIKGARLNVDHNHDTGAVRGLLCRKCNAAIGLLGDDPDLVLAALSYLRRQS